MNPLRFTYRAWKRAKGMVRRTYDNVWTHTIFYLNGIKHGSFHTTGRPVIKTSVRMGGIKIGDKFAMNNSYYGVSMGRTDRCAISALEPGATITIGDNVGITQTQLVSTCALTIGNNVKIGIGSIITTTDYHSLDYKQRRTAEDKKYRKSAPIVIEDDVFIGSRCTILKGVTIGARSIVGAGSVVTKSIPADEIWAGNPAKFIKKINIQEA